MSNSVKQAHIVHGMSQAGLRSLKRAIYAVCLCTAVPVFSQVVDLFEARTHRTAYDTVVYRLFVPAHYDGNTEYPIILTFHGAGERGDNNYSQLANNVVTPWFADSFQARHPCFIVSPQCPVDEKWADFSWSSTTYRVSSTPISAAMRTVLSLLDSLKREFSLDTNRFYVCGLSMGGCGSWDIIARYPDMFAAAVPVCGVGDSSAATDLQKTAIWAYHGTLDPTVPVAGSRGPLSSLEGRGNTVVRYISKQDGGNANMSWDTLTAKVAAGADYIYTEYTDGVHGIWNTAFLNPLLPEWLLSKVKNRGNTRISLSRGLHTAKPVLFTTQSNGTIQVKAAGGYHLNMYSVTGVMVASYERIGPGNVHVTHIPNGVYFVALRCKQGIQRGVLSKID
ncbi:MAG: hypothetical protein A2268_14395 [Candidatus Raymondbacteria bacterium RifOxyA12_full_50_37]|uniref:Phospholipase/carboxylesterase/thioesterase domain-containing protein n=1 Tax=Candidatus Raymondbacteria bacterium RIFOXYD12_FULL_49_13 TaxID=1817890 RepID=A0A1F7F958_UNCRA|nr:MAG: hypothetical protein A2268_14395 [Candidatus Raymondbacteria bacterium RifOxyA12_full_50_37]OGJ88610.1 MAG: hypothetical protein A2248_20330 [Candidatus Raymondbacteria bacterium RIFOXYA2_FULL_49_16]OGJ99787.1 MAG: hypothetical protein A2350_06325 [Candidatus Raymondbacteria bacterium RifOxyB12_full_50_8]OGK03151.1 MAG: hypothetical protein A2519_07035 [Candidatus Raymondbacteria bacterium RIFOXYD12_FULL_49_13]OGK06454.1 MAG: hypothetical protein A2487_12020 [Candidatus Raymondbacteria 